MSDELIDSYIDRAAIKSETDFFISQLDILKKAKNDLSAIKASLNIATNAKDIASVFTQSTSAINQSTQAIQANSKAQQANAQQQVLNAKAREEARFAQAKMNKELKATVEIENTEVGSIARARAELKGLNILRNNTTTATREGREELKRLNAEIDRNNKFIKENADASLKQKLNIGNYPQLFSGVGDGIKNIASGLLATVGVTAGLAGIASFFSDSIAEANQAEQATTRFRNALANIGREDVFERLNDKANKFVNTFKYLDNDDITEVFQQLISYGKLTEQQISDLTPVIINFAAKTGVSLNESASVIIKALEGQGRALKEYGIDIKEGSTVTERFGIIMSDLAVKVQGAGEAFGNSFAGKVASARQEINNLKEDVGTKLLPVMLSFYKAVSVSLDALGKGFKFIKGAVTDVANGDIFRIGKTFFDERDKTLKSEEVNSIASNLLDGSQKKSIEEKKKMLTQLNEKLVSLQNQYRVALTKGDKDLSDRLLKTAEGYRKAREILTATIKGTQDTSVLGIGNPDKVEKEVKVKVGKKTKDTKSIEEQIKEIIQKFKELEKPIVAPVEVEIKPITYKDTSAAYDKQLERRLTENAIAFSKEQIAIAEQFDNGKIGREKYEKDLLDIQKKYSTQALLLQIEEYERSLEFALDGVELTQDIADKKAKIEKDLYDYKAKLAKKEKEDAEDAEKNRFDKLVAGLEYAKDITSKLSESAGNLFGIGYDAEKARNEEKLTAIEKRRDTELAAINALNISETEKAAKVQQLEAHTQSQREALARRNRQLEAEKARFDKAATISQIIIDTSLAVVRALGMKPYTPANISLAALTAAVGASSLARAISAPTPRYRLGKSKHDQYEGAAIWGEERSELKIGSDGSMEISPNRPTLTYVKKDDIIVPDAAAYMKEKALSKLSNISKQSYVQNNSANINMKPLEKKLDGVISAVNNKASVYFNVSERGVETMVMKGQAWDEYLNKYVRGQA